MRAEIVRFPAHLVKKRRAPIESAVVPFTHREIRPYAEIELAMLRIAIALAELAVVATIALLRRPEPLSETERTE